MYMIQWCRLDGSIAFTVYQKTENAMLQEIVDCVNKGFIAQVGKISKGE